MNFGNMVSFESDVQAKDGTHGLSLWNQRRDR